jgi:hypothetical protein
MRVATPAEAMQILRCGSTHLNELVQSRALRSYLDGTARRIFVESIHQYQVAQAAMPKPAPKPRSARKPRPEPSAPEPVKVPKLEPAAPKTKAHLKARAKPWRTTRRGRGR